MLLISGAAKYAATISVTFKRLRFIGHVDHCDSHIRVWLSNDSYGPELCVVVLCESSGWWVNVYQSTFWRHLVTDTYPFQVSVQLV